jgi:hypothetical protein
MPKIVEFVLYWVLKFEVELVKFSLCFIKHQVINVYWGEKLIASRVRYLITRRK